MTRTVRRGTALPQRTEKQVTSDRMAPPARSTEAGAQANTEAVGVTIVTGFLGAGKSTLIRRVLTEQHGLRVVVVENEFGASSGVESAIVTQGLGAAAFEDFVELPNGCICCSAQSGLTDALSRLVAERRGGARRVDHVLVEASGLADPGPVAAQFWLDEALATELRLDAVVAVVDAANVARQLAAPATAALARKQVAVADALVLNKRDLAGEKPFAAARAAVAALCPAAEVLPATKCDVNIAQVLNIRAYDPATAQRDAERFAAHVSHVPTGAAAVVVRFADVRFDERRLERALGALLWEDCEGEESNGEREIWRMKALVFMKGEETLRVYQGVHTLFAGEETDISAAGRADRDSVFIFIGRALEEGWVRAGLAGAIVEQRSTA